MKRYGAFAGDHYYPEGGWSDFKGSFDTKDEAVRAVSHSEWWQVVDLQSGVEVDYGNDRI